MTDTTTLTNRILLAVVEAFPNCRVWRRNTGSGYPLANVQSAISALKRGDANAALQHLERCRPIRWGMPGEGDIDGFIGPNGRRISIEVKNPATGDRLRPEQRVCRELYERFGCIYIVGTSPEQVVEELRKRI